MVKYIIQFHLPKAFNLSIFIELFKFIQMYLKCRTQYVSPQPSNLTMGEGWGRQPLSLVRKPIIWQDFC